VGYRLNEANGRYDAVPDDLVLNNTLQIVYNPANAKAEEVEFDTIEVLDDTKFVPILHSAMAPADVEFRLDVFFDVSCFTRRK
jgi:iron transport multicopper oxidase